MRFRITDLIFLTTAVALLIAAFQTDLQFFRQLFCFGLITPSRLSRSFAFRNCGRRPAVGAIGGLAGGLIYLTLPISGLQCISVGTDYLIRQAMAKDIQYLGWTHGAISIFAIFAVPWERDRAIAALRIRKTILPENSTNKSWLSVMLLAAAFLLALFAMFDRLTLFGIRVIGPR